MRNAWIHASPEGIYLPIPPHDQDAFKDQFFKAKFNKFEFGVFFLLNHLLWHG